jgi:hypothetical protein
MIVMYAKLIYLGMIDGTLEYNTIRVDSIDDVRMIMKCLEDSTTQNRKELNVPMEDKNENIPLVNWFSKDIKEDGETLTRFQMYRLVGVDLIK